MGKIKIYVFFIGLFAAFPLFAVDPISAGFFLASVTGATVSMFTATVVAFVANYAISTIVNRAFSKKPPKIQDNGVRQQIPPASTNSIPVAYGDVYLGGNFVDAVLSENQKVMWYVMAISHISTDGTFTFDKTQFYYGDRLITFDTTEPAKVISLTDGSGNVDTKIADNLYIYLYRSSYSGVITNLDNGGTSPGSANPDVIMSNAAGVPAGLEWPASGRQMNGLAFAIVKLIYSQEDDAVQLQQLTFKASHTLYGTGVADPGSVWFDYIKNPIYGGAMPDSLVDQPSAYNLAVYSNELITFTDNQGNPSTQPRYRINGVLDTGQTVLENLDQILMAADSWMAYNAPTGKWSIVINKAESTSFAFNDSNIIGDIKVGTIDINQAINQIEARFPSKLNKDIPDYIFLSTPSYLLYPNEPVNKYTFSLDLVNDSVQAQYLCNRMLEQAREDLILTIRTTYSGIQINAGDVVSVTNAAYGWSAKLFRVMKVNETSLPDGSLGASLELNEYNAQVYDDKPITEFEPAPNTDLPSGNYFSPLSAPTVTDQLPTATIPSFAVECVMPTSGRVTNIYLYYTTISSPAPEDWELLAQQSLSNSQVYPNATPIKFTNIILPADTYYFAFKVSNDTSQSALSPASAAYAWLPNPTSTTVGSAFVAQFNPPVLQVPYDTAPNFTGIAPQLYGTVAGGAIDYVNAGSDSDTLFVNNTWRIGASATTGLADIVKTNITIGDPTDAGNYALFPNPTAMSSSPATIDVPVRYKDNLGNVVQSANATCQLTFNVKGDTGAAGNKTATVSLYQWSTTTPSNPNGQSTYTWATGTNSSYTGGNGWTTTVPANPGIPLVQLWTATKAITAPGTDVTTTVSWVSGFSVQSLSQNGANGAPGTRSATPTVYQWAITIPAGPTGTSTYTWSSNTFTPTPSGWTLTGGTAPSAGYTLWAARVNLVDSSTVTTSTINWTTATIAAVGYAGTNGSTGQTGSSARICYSKTTLSSLASSPATITTTGSTSFPPNGSWGADTVWQATPPSIVAGESVYQSDGIYNPATGNTVWNVPYLSALKVGSLSAISANMGQITAGTITGALIRTAASGKRIELNSSANAFRAYDASNFITVEIGGTQGTVYASTTSSGVTSIVGAGSTYANGVAGTSTNNNGVQGISSTSAGTSGFTTSGFGIYGESSGSSGIGTRGVNANRGTSGSIGLNAAYDFYADGSGTNYGPFTGAHDCIIELNQNIQIGQIMVDQFCACKKNVSNTIFAVELSSEANQPAIGIFVSDNGLLADYKPAAFVESMTYEINPVYVMYPEYDLYKETYNYSTINAVGEGQVLVCGENGDIQPGDLIVTSSLPGIGMKQSDNIVRSITVAKARETVNFASATETKLIACIYLCG